MSRLPNAEGLLSEFLRSDPDVVDLVGDRVYTSLPPDPTFPAVRLTRVGGSPKMARPWLLDEAALQVDVWGGPKAEAWKLAEEIREAIAERLPGRHDKGLVYGASFGPLRDLPDPTFDPAKPRYVFDVTLTTRA